MENTIWVRFASIEDAHELSCMNDEFNEVKIPVEKIASVLESNDELVAVAEVQGQMAGFACAQSYKSFCYEALQGEITEMYVREAFRREGIGSALVVFLEEELIRRGVDQIKILTGGYNKVAQAVYASKGYTAEDEMVFMKEI